jgi:hypothetical protein
MSDARLVKISRARPGGPLTSAQTTGWGQKTKKKKHPEKIPPEKYFPGDFFLKRTHFFSRVFELPLPRNAQKRTKKKKKKKVRTYFFCELAQMYVVFSFYFFGRPLALGIETLRVYTINTTHYARRTARAVKVQGTTHNRS